MFSIPQGYTLASATPGPDCVEVIAVSEAGEIWRCSASPVLDFSAYPAIEAVVTQDMRDAYLASLPADPPLTEADYAAAIQSHVDATARSRGYQDGFAFAGYSTSTIPAWAAEAQTFIAWRDSVWLYAYQELAKVQNQERAQPSPAELVAELPSVVWP